MIIHSIRTRILGGFAALILLQAAVALAVWRAEDRVDRTTASDAAAEAGLGRVVEVRAALSLVQLQLANFVRTGAITDRDRVQQALASFAEGYAKVGALQGNAQFSTGVAGVQSGLQAVIDIQSTRRNAVSRVELGVSETENALAALAQAAPKAPERPALEAAVAALPGVLHPLIFAERFAFSGDEPDARIFLASAAKAKEAVRTLLDGAGSTPRIQRFAANLEAALDAMPPGLSALTTVLAARAEALVRLDAATDLTRAAIEVVQAEEIAERQRLRAESASARLAVRETVLGAAGLSGIMGIGLAMLVGFSITRPVGRLALAMRRIADGSLTLDVPDRRRRDEIGGMAGAVQVFKDNMIRADRLAAEQDQVKAAAALAQKAALNETADGFEVAVGGLAASLSSCAGELQQTAQSMSSTAAATNAQASTVAAAAEQASISVQAVAGAAEQLTASIHEISRQIAQSSEITGRAVFTLAFTGVASATAGWACKPNPPGRCRPTWRYKHADFDKSSKRPSAFPAVSAEPRSSSPPSRRAK